MNKFRASYSVLYLWSKGQYEEAVKTYFKLPRFENQAMRDGKNFHDDWRIEIEKFATLPSAFGREKLVNPIPERKLTCELGEIEWLEIVGIPDLIDEKTIYEFKTGSVSASTYANTFQAGLYGLLAIKNGIFIDRIIFMQYNQYTKRSETSYVWLTEKRIREAVDWVVTHASDMHNYLEENGLYEEYKAPEEIISDDLEADILQVDEEELNEE